MQNLSYEDEFGLRETHFHVDNKSIHMTQEQPVIIACIPVARISKNLQFFTKGPRIWNCLPASITNLSSFPSFKNKVLEFLLNSF